MRTAESVYQRALGADFARLQPELQQYFSLAPAAENDDGATVSGVGSGTFDVAGCPVPVLRPFLGLTSSDNAMFPEYQHEVPFTIENRASQNAAGQPQLTALRTLHFHNRPRIMEDLTSWDDNLGTAVGALGRSGRLLTDVMCSVGTGGRMRIISRRSRLAAGRRSVRLPLLFDAAAFTEQWWDESGHRFRIRTKVIQRQFGTVLEYDGSFTYSVRA
jgi:hypothetical protein